MFDQCIRCMGSNSSEWICTEVGIFADDWESKLFYFPVCSMRISRRHKDSHGECSYKARFLCACVSVTCLPSPIRPCRFFVVEGAE